MDDIISTSKRYWRSAGRKGLAHYFAAEIYAKRHHRIGFPTIALSAAVATSIFSALNESVATWIRIVAGAIAVIAAILTALQTFLGYGERAEKHRNAGARYEKLRRDIDVFQLKFGAAGNPSATREDALKALQGIATELGSLATDSPSLSESVYIKGERVFDQTHP